MSQELTPEQMNRMIAEAVGWKREIFGPLVQDYRWHFEGHPVHHEPPNYCNDLNAMAQAEAMLSDDEWDEYCEQLGGSLRGCASAPASRRSTAFCRVLQTRKGE